MNPPPLSRARITTCILVNLAATPGLGSLWARRLVAGSLQLLLAIVGFCLITGWMLKTILTAVSEQMDGTTPSAPGWMWKWGLVIFGASWLWSLVTSISLWHEIKPEAVPPKLSE